MPVECHIIDLVGSDIFLHEMLEHFICHPGLSSAIYFALVKIVAIAAAEVAEGAGRLEHDVECHRA
jgi:hypothetical protein